MTRKRVSGIHKFAVLIALSAFIPSFAAAQEQPGPLPSTYSYGCWDPWSAADFICEDLIWDGGYPVNDLLDLIGTNACRAYCRNVRATCLRHVMATSRCLDRLNKDLLTTWSDACRGWEEGSPPDIKACRQSQRDFALWFKASLLVSQSYGKEECRDCYSWCLDVCGDMMR